MTFGDVVSSCEQALKKIIKHLKEWETGKEGFEHVKGVGVDRWGGWEGREVEAAVCTTGELFWTQSRWMDA